ncbi:hypothetical protein R3P38DRAFT_3239691 [Favolaschia claudopus]|uniref:F-box domain-containing protein n=1 Tax=Favolaschia claudopus TaxID=2862362 RepID=A0AAV9Z882_9AGAR
MGDGEDPIPFVNRLPRELLARVLRPAFLGPCFLVHDPSYRRRVVLSVCHTWERALRRDPYSWNYIVLDPATSLLDLYDSLSMSTSLGLFIELVCAFAPGTALREFVQWVFDVIGPSLHRCKELRIQSHYYQTTLDIMRRFQKTSMPRLSRVYFELALPMVPASPDMPDSIVPFPSGAVLPSLTHASFNYSLPVWPWHQFAANLTSLRLARLTGFVLPRLLQLYDLLKACPNLETLALHFVDAVSPRLTSEFMEYADSPVTLPRLKRMDLSLEWPRSVSVIAPLHLPSLRCLRLFAADDRVLEAFLLRCRSILAPVHTLVFAANISSFQSLAALLSAMPSLVRIDGRLAGPSFVSQLHCVALHSSALSPTLLAVVLNQVPIALVKDILLLRNRTNFASDFHLIVLDPACFGALAAMTNTRGVVTTVMHLDFVDWLEYPMFPSISVGRRPLLF